MFEIRENLGKVRRYSEDLEDYLRELLDSEKQYKEQLRKNFQNNIFCIFFNFSHIYQYLRDVNVKGKEFPELLLEESDLGLTILKFSLMNILADEPMFCEVIRKIRMRNLDIHVGLFNVSKYSGGIINLNEICGDHINKIVEVEGVIKVIHETRPSEKYKLFSCSKCGKIIIQNPLLKEKPKRCPYCGSNFDKENPLTEEGSIYEDVSIILIEDLWENISDDQPGSKYVIFRGDLAVPSKAKKIGIRFTPGSKIRVVGIVRLPPSPKKSKKGLLLSTYYIDAIYAKTRDYSPLDIKISQSDEKIIKELASRKDIYEIFKRSIATKIKGYDEIKEALVLQLFGGVKKKKTFSLEDYSELKENFGEDYKEDIEEIEYSYSEKESILLGRGDIHILLVGDPGVGKSQILQEIAKVAPKGRFISGIGSSRAGLTAAVVRDEVWGGWKVEAGALILSHQGLLCIDELDKMNKEDREALHTAMEQQIITIDKGGIHQTFLTETSILAAANPKEGRFSSDKSIVEQINLPPTLMSRFDLIFAIRDVPNTEKDKALATHLLNIYKSFSEKSKREKKELILPPSLIKKYIAYAKKNVNPVLTDEAIRKIVEFYVSLREKGKEHELVTITPRQLDALVRLSEASARVRLSNYVTVEDAERAIKLLNFSFSNLGLVMEGGLIDVDALQTGTPMSKRKEVELVREILKDLKEKYPEGIPYSHILREYIKIKQKRDPSLTEEKCERMLNDIMEILYKNNEIIKLPGNKYDLV